MYEYNAVVDRVVDGDTIDCTIDLGFKTWKKVRVRMEGINTPESRTRDLEEILKYNDNTCILKISGLGKYGRALATVFVENLSPVATEALTLINVNSQLVTEGHAIEYHGGKR
jgi:endonuclease YncB( thermonuclease family)